MSSKKSKSTIAYADILRVAAEALADPRTVMRVYAGAPTKKLTYKRISQTAGKLGLTLPPEPKS